MSTNPFLPVVLLLLAISKVGAGNVQAVEIVTSPVLHRLQEEDHPSSSVGGLRLSSVLEWRPEAPGQITHHTLSEEEHDRRRRLRGYNITDGCCSLKTERERVRTSAALNFHFYPYAYDELFDDAAGEAAWGRAAIYDANDGLDVSTGAGGTTGAERAKSAEMWQKKQQQFMATFLTSDVLTADWDPRHFPEDTFNDGADDATGVAMGVYESSDGEKMLVFRGSYSAGDFDNIVKWIKDWILDRMESRVKQAWVDEGYSLTAEMKARSGGDLKTRCALRAGTTAFTHMHNEELAASAPGISKEDIKKYGYWPLTKHMVRQVLPSDRDMAAEGPIYISGHSQGGARASLVSMWLEKEDGKKYRTYALSPVGCQCFARKLSFLPGSSNGHNYLEDVDPYVNHDQIVAYLHPFDFYALMDYQVGTVCKYGTSRLGTDMEGGSDLMPWVEATIGYTGPELMVDMFDTTAPDAFSKTRMWTHSILWMNALFANETMLDANGVTDGGCHQEVVIPHGGSLCPDGNSDKECNALFLGVGVFIFCLIVGIPVCCCACTHTCCFRKSNKDNKTMFERTVRPAAVRTARTIREKTMGESRVAPEA